MRKTSGEKNPKWYGLHLWVIVVVSSCFMVAGPLAAEEKTSTQSSFEKLVKDAKRTDGLLPLYMKEDKLLVEVPRKTKDEFNL